MKFCSNCGFQMEDGINFCPKCGTPQVAGNPAGANNNQPGNNMNNSFNNGAVNQAGYNQNPNPQPTPQSAPQQPNYTNQNNNQNYTNQNYPNQNYTNTMNDNQGNYQQPQSFESGFTIGQPSHLDFNQSIRYILEHKFDFNPTIQDNQKSIFWWSQLLLWILSTAISLIMIPILSATGSYLLLILIAAISIPLALMAIPPIMRRLNYLGKNKNLAWFFFVPFGVFYIWYLMLLDRSQLNHA